MTAKMDWELPPKEALARMDAAFADGSMDEAYRMAEEVFPPRADIKPPQGPAYYGWAIREVFLAGVRWERERQVKEE